MSAQHEMQNPGDPPVDITQHVLAPGIGEDGFSLETHAEEGSVGSSEVVFDDPDGTFYPIGLNAYRVRETTSEADDPLIYVGAFGSRRETRGPYRTGGSRHVVAQVQDANSGLSRYVVRVGEGGNRPEETETDRMEWLFTTSGMALHWDISTSILELGSTVMAAADLTDYTPQQILDDMAQQTGKNYYVYIDGSVDPPEALLVYARDSGTHLTSDLRFSNVIEDVDDETTFYAGLDWEQDINPERVASYISVRYANGRVDESDSGTADEFSRIDKVQDAPLIKTAGVATARALEYLDELDSEETTLKGTVYLPAEKASQFRAGMRCEMKASHLTGMSDFVWVRLLSVTVVQLGEDPALSYALAFEGTFTPSSVTSCAAIVSELTVQDSGSQPTVPGGSNSPVGWPITPPSSGDFLTIGFVCVSQPHTALGEHMDIASPWTWLDGFEHGDTIDTLHTFSGLAYLSNATTEPEWTWDGNTTDTWRQLAVTIPTAATAPVQTAVSGVFPSDVTAGNLLVLLRVAQGPSGWDTDPAGGWTLLAQVDVAEVIPTPFPTMEVWVLCAPEGFGDTVDYGSSATFNLGHVTEVSLT